MTGSSQLSRALTGFALGAVALPLVQFLDRPAGGWTWAPPAAVVLALATAARSSASSRRPTFAWLGGAIVLTSAWLLPQATAGPATLMLGIVIGAALGLAAASAARLRDGAVAAWFGVGMLQIILLALPGRAGAIAGAGLCALAMLALGTLGRTAERSPGPRPWPGAAGAAALTVLTTCWVGANSLNAAWFGALVTHGPRDGRLVAITFDDGPDARSTLAIRDVLDRYRVKATFFTVGKALDARPDISRALASDGQLLGNHSYHHDALGWLDPAYPELERTQRAFARRLRTCPSFFRPPHGQHTPFMAHVAARHRMTMVGWDVSAGDWATSDPQLVAGRILRKVRPGSIVLLHDGLDGNVDADRSVVVRALPLILRGLRARHLRPVRLDRLLGRPGYRGRC